MALPQLYRYGREGHWFGLKWFTLYMLDGVAQVRDFCDIAHPSIDTRSQSVVIYFLIAYTYWTTTSRTDGWDVYLYEFSTVRNPVCMRYHLS